MKQLKKWVIIICLILIVITLMVINGGWMTTTKAKTYRPHPFTSQTLSNGLELLLVSDPTLPYITYEVLFKGGTKQDPEGKEGVMSLLTASMDKGTKHRTAVELAEGLELMGSSLSVELDEDYVSFSVSSLSWLSEQVLKVFSEMMTQVVFKEQEFERSRKKAIGNVKRSSENFSYYTHRVFNKYVFGNHPYSFYPHGDLKSLKSITLEDVKQMYKQAFNPSKAVLGVSGRLPKNIVEQLEKAFGTWGQGDSQAKKNTTLNKNISTTKNVTHEEKKLLLVDHPSAVQSELRMGHISVPSSHPDYLALKTANVILGGSGMTSHLMQRVRVQKGLTYGVMSYFDAKQISGLFLISMATRNTRVGYALLEIQSVLDAFYKSGITKNELKEAQVQLTTRFIRRTADVENFTHYLMYLNSQNLSYRFAEEYLYNINSLNVKKVNKAVRQHLHTDKMKILVFSRKNEVEQQLQDYQPLMIKNYKDFL